MAPSLATRLLRQLGTCARGREGRPASGRSLPPWKRQGKWKKQLIVAAAAAAGNIPVWLGAHTDRTPSSRRLRLSTNRTRKRRYAATTRWKRCPLANTQTTDRPTDRLLGATQKYRRNSSLQDIAPDQRESLRDTPHSHHSRFPLCCNFSPQALHRLTGVVQFTP